VARCLGRDHDHVEVSTRHHLVVVDRETVGEGQDGAFLQIRLQLFLVQLALEFVRGQDHYQVSSSNCGGDISHFQAVGFSFGDRRRTGTQTDSDIYTGVLEIARMSVALGAITDDGDLFALDNGEVAVFVVINFHGISSDKSGLSGHFKTSDTQYLVTTGNPGDTTAYGFQNRRGADGLDETVQLPAGSRYLNGVDAGCHIDDLPTEDIGRTLDLGALGASSLNLDQHQLTLDMRAFRQVHQLYHFDQLVE